MGLQITPKDPSVKSIHVEHLSAFSLGQLLECLDLFEGERVVSSVYVVEGAGAIVFNQYVPHSHIAKAVDEAGLVASNHGLAFYMPD
jgi:hypothetical protein